MAINTLGPPTFFVTLTANDLHWPELFMLINPTLTADMVAQLGQEKPLGIVKDYWMRIKFQMRGCPHVHSFWWIEGAPKVDTVQGRQQAPQFIDQYISTVLPDPTTDPELHRLDPELHRLVSTLQVLLHVTRTTE